MSVNINTHTLQSGSWAHLPGRDNKTKTAERKAEMNRQEKDYINLGSIAAKYGKHTSANVCECTKKGKMQVV